MRTMLLYFVLAFVAGSAVMLAEDVPTTAWGKQYGFASENIRVTADKAGNCFIAGTTNDSLSSSFAGKKDAFVRKFDTAGNALWTINIGSTMDDIVHSVVADKDGNCYVAGKTLGELASANLGLSDAFLVKINAYGEILWKRQFGTDKNDDILFITTDGEGNCFVTGSTAGNFEGTNAGSLDAILIKYDENGSVIWKKQYGETASEAGEYITFDKNNTVYTVLSTKKILQYDHQGNYIRQSSHTIYQAHGIVVDDSLNIYIGGYSGLGNGSKAVLVKYDMEMTKMWEIKFGSGPWTGINSMMKFQDGSSDILVGVCQAWPNCFAVCRRYDTNGNAKWIYTLQEPTGKSACGHLVATDGAGNCFITGITDGNLFDTRVKAEDVFLSKIILSPQTNIKNTGAVPNKYQLFQNYPNPFNPSTVIRYLTASYGNVKLNVYNMLGQKVKSLVNSYQSAGEHSVVWNGTDDNNNEAISGVYICRMETDEKSFHRKMLLIR